MLPEYMFYIKDEFPLSKIIQKVCEISHLNLQCNVGMDDDIVLAPLAQENNVLYEKPQDDYMYYGFYFVGFKEKVYVKLRLREKKVFVSKMPKCNYLTLLLAQVFIELGLRQELKYHEFFQKLTILKQQKNITLEEQENFEIDFFKELDAEKNGVIEYIIPTEWSKQKWDSELIPEEYRLTPMEKIPKLRTYSPFGGNIWYVEWWEKYSET